MDRDQGHRAPRRPAVTVLVDRAIRATRAALPAAVLAAGAALVALATLLAMSASAATASATGAGRVPGLGLTSSAFPNQGEIPAAYTCEAPGGGEVSPPLSWSGVPSAARSLALIVQDPDAPDPAAPQTTWVHWVLYDLPPAAAGLPAGAASGQLPPGARQGVNDWGRTGYGGPCPPIGRHRYFFKLYALDAMLPDLGAPTKGRLEERLHGHVLAQAELIGTYRKSGR
jgi:Raf kinase inhibitor-like YbhB/YbcL family protein